MKTRPSGPARTLLVDARSTATNIAGLRGGSVPATTAAATTR